jgi:phosphoenolpyruvate synthase/pyruvate phosphate dikinase
MGKPTVVAAKKVTVDWQQQTLSCADRPQLVARRGDMVTVDGDGGSVYLGALPTIHTGNDANLVTVMQWADQYKRMAVLAEADSAEEAAEAMRMGADGIGLCRTERMFSQPDRLTLFRRAILSSQSIERSTWLHQLLPLMESDFHDLFRAVGGRTVIIRLLDPPLHEFLPCPGPGFEQDIQELAQRLEMGVEDCRERVLQLQESNPALGLRGCRLSILYPEVTELQTKAFVGKLLLSALNRELCCNLIAPDAYTTAHRRCDPGQTGGRRSEAADPDPAGGDGPRGRPGHGQHRGRSPRYLCPIPYEAHAGDSGDHGGRCGGDPSCLHQGRPHR